MPARARAYRQNAPVRLVYVELAPDRVSAMKRELQIKRLGHEGKQKLANRAEGNLAGNSWRQSGKRNRASEAGREKPGRVRGLGGRAGRQDCFTAACMEMGGIRAWKRKGL